MADAAAHFRWPAVYTGRDCARDGRLRGSYGDAELTTRPENTVTAGSKRHAIAATISLAGSKLRLPETHAPRASCDLALTVERDRWYSRLTIRTGERTSVGR